MVKTIDKKCKVAINQVWRELDTNCDRFVRVLEAYPLDAKVRSCLLNGVLCARTPVFKISISDLLARFSLVSVLSVFQIDEAAQDDPTVPRLATPENGSFANRHKRKK